MTNTEIEDYLFNLENSLINESKRQKIDLTKEWADNFPQSAGVYILREGDEIIYVGESGFLSGRMKDILDTRNHSLRRRIGSLNFSNVLGFEKASSRKKFIDEIELMIDNYLKEKMEISYLEVPLGRKELEERIIEKYPVKYNNIRKRGSEERSYNFAEVRRDFENAYMTWSKEEDEKLEILFCEKKSVKELSTIFGRNSGAIRSRINKLELKEKYGRRL